MNKPFTQDIVFKDIDYSVKPLDKGEYDTCTFINCNFADSDLSAITFIECELDTCNLSMATMNSVAFNDVHFKTCKLLGANFNNCNNFGFDANFEDCHLNLASFYKLKLKGTQFKNCSLQEVDFIETDLSDACFDNCNLSRAVFENTNLEKADFLTSYNYSIDPEINKIRKAKFSRSDLHGLLGKYDIIIE